MTKIRVLVVDDSALVRSLLAEIINRQPDMACVGAASDPLVARELIRQLDPDVITLDVEMPNMNGLAFLERLMAARPIPVVMVSSLTARGSELALRALELGAIDIVEKPRLDVKAGTFALADELLRKVRGAASARPRRRIPGPSAAAPDMAAPLAFRTTDRVIAIGASTGGTEAIATVLAGMPLAAPGIVMVQHLPPQFCAGFAERLDRLSRMDVRVAVDGERVTAGLALLAPGDRHMRVVRNGATYVVRLSTEPPLNNHRPAVDVLFDSVATAAGRSAVGVLLTGMGADGARGMLAMRNAGAATIAQDEHSCVVFGMPKEAISRGAAQHVLPLDRITSAALRAAA